MYQTQKGGCEDHRILALENDYHLIVNASQNASKIAEKVLEPII